MSDDFARYLAARQIRYVRMGKQRPDNPGWPDFLIFPRSPPHVALLFKHPRGTVTDPQVAFMIHLREAGYSTHVCHSMEDALNSIAVLRNVTN